MWPAETWTTHNHTQKYSNRVHSFHSLYVCCAHGSCGVLLWRAMAEWLHRGHTGTINLEFNRSALCVQFDSIKFIKWETHTYRSHVPIVIIITTIADILCFLTRRIPFLLRFQFWFFFLSLWRRFIGFVNATAGGKYAHNFRCQSCLHWNLYENEQHLIWMHQSKWTNGITNSYLLCQQCVWTRGECTFTFHRMRFISDEKSRLLCVVDWLGFNGLRRSG